MMKVRIADKEYSMVYNLKTLFTYETIAGKPYEGKLTIETYTLAYSMLLANNDDFSYSFDEFIAFCDDDPSIYDTLIEVLNAYAKRMSAFASKKKVTK